MKDAHYAFLSCYFSGSNQLRLKGLPQTLGSQDSRTQPRWWQPEGLCPIFYCCCVVSTWKAIWVKEWNFSWNNLPWSTWDVRKSVLICATHLLHKSSHLKVRKLFFAFNSLSQLRAVASKDITVTSKSWWIFYYSCSLLQLEKPPHPLQDSWTFLCFKSDLPQNNNTWSRTASSTLFPPSNM